MDEILLKSLLNVLLHWLLFHDGQWTLGGRQQVRQQVVNRAVPWLMRWYFGCQVLAEYILECPVIERNLLIILSCGTLIGGETGDSGFDEEESLFLSREFDRRFRDGS